MSRGDCFKLTETWNDSCPRLTALLRRTNSNDDCSLRICPGLAEIRGAEFRFDCPQINRILRRQLVICSKESLDVLPLATNKLLTQQNNQVSLLWTKLNSSLMFIMRTSSMSNNCFTCRRMFVVTITMQHLCVLKFCMKNIMTFLRVKHFLECNTENFLF